MNHDERQLIADLFERMKSVQNLDKDVDAEAFIHQSMRENGNSPYLLVQSVLAQEVALQEAGKRIEELESQLQGAQSATSTGPRASAGFSGAPGAVPTGQAAPWETPSNATGASSSGIWGAPPSHTSPAQSPPPQAASQTRSSGIPATGAAAPGRASSVPPAGAQQSRGGGGGGGFMRQAMGTAAGVAGGMLLANSIGSLFGGGSTPASASTSTDPASTNATDTAAADTSGAESQAADQSPGLDDQDGFQDAAHDDWGDDAGWDGGDDFGGDFEI